MTNMEISFRHLRVSVINSEFDLCNKLHEYAKIIEQLLSDEYRKKLESNEIYTKTEGDEPKRVPRYSELDCSLILLGYRNAGFLSRIDLKPLEIRNASYPLDRKKITRILFKSSLTIHKIGILALRVDIELPHNFAKKHLKDFYLSDVPFELSEEEQHSWGIEDEQKRGITNINDFYKIILLNITKQYNDYLGKPGRSTYQLVDTIRCIKYDSVYSDILKKNYGINIIDNIRVREDALIQISDYAAFIALVKKGRDYRLGGKTYDDNSMLEYCRLLLEYVMATSHCINYLRDKIPLVAESIYDKRNIDKMLSEQSDFSQLERYYARLRIFSETILSAHEPMIDLKKSFHINERLDNIDIYITHFGSAINQHLNKKIYKSFNRMNIMMLVMTGALIILAILTWAKC